MLGLLLASHGLRTRTSKEKTYIYIIFSNCTINQLQCVVHSLKMGILKSDQFYALSMHLTELFVAKDMLVKA